MSTKWKVLIADDEPIIRLGLREVIEHSDLPLQVVAEAEDGEEALELALHFRVEIALVDLNMPIMDGVKLMRKLRDQIPQCRIVIVSGHDEFEYAREAIRLNVDEYILKPVNPDQLCNVLARTCERIAMERKQERYLYMAKKQIEENYPLLMERFFQNWLEGNLSNEEVAEQIQFLQLPEAPLEQLIVIRCPVLSTEQRIWSERDRQLFLFAVENIVSELLVNKNHRLFRDRNGQIIAITWSMPSGNSHEDVNDEITEEPLDTYIEQKVRNYLKIPVHVCIQSMEGDYEQLSQAYENCRSTFIEESSPIVRRARQIIRERFIEPQLTLESLADTLQVSPVYLSRMIKYETGVSYIQLVTQIRMERAVQLLIGTDLPIIEIASRVGYDSQHYFSTAFKKIFGVSPLQYRKSSSISP